MNRCHWRTTDGTEPIRGAGGVKLERRPMAGHQRRCFRGLVVLVKGTKLVGTARGKGSLPMGLWCWEP